MKTPLDKLVALLDKTLDNGAFKDASHNGLQLANNGVVKRVVTGVDANLRLLEVAAERGADCVVCHHGLSWGDSLARITGVNYKLVSFAMQHNIAVYASHLPLDAHATLGNNAQICKALGLVRPKRAVEYHGQTIGCIAECPRVSDFDGLCARIRAVVSPEMQAHNFGPRRVQRVAVVSGGAADMAEQAQALGADLFLTGEGSLQGYNLAEHLELNIVFAGHYATETFGVRALASLIEQRLRVPAEFIDFKLPY